VPPVRGKDLHGMPERNRGANNPSSVRKAHIYFAEGQTRDGILFVGERRGENETAKKHGKVRRKECGKGLKKKSANNFKVSA